MNAQRKFFLKLILVSLPAWAWVLWQALLPLNQYTFRGWEALVAGKGWSSGFYPSQTLMMNEVGDLVPYTLDAVPHTVEWKTDRFGYRNDPAQCSDPKVVILGDSMA